MLKKLIILISFYSILGGCNNSPANNGSNNIVMKDTSLPALFYKKLFGNIGENAVVKMDLTRINDSILEGRYYIDETMAPRNIRGVIKNSRDVILKEFDSNDMASGVFIGKFISPDSFEGSWENLKSNSKSAFKLHEIKEGTTPIEFEQLNARNCKRAEENIKLNKENNALADTTCSRILINLIKIPANKSAELEMVNAAIAYSICTTQKTKFENINAFLNSVNNTSKLNELNITEISCGVVMNEKNILSIAINRYNNFGGMNPNFECNYLNYDLNTGKQISLEELFVANYLNELNEIAEKLFNESSGNNRHAGAHFKLTTNFAITPGGLIFLFNPNDPGAFATDVPEKFIPYKSIEKLLNPSGVLSRFRGKQSI